MAANSGVNDRLKKMGFLGLSVSNALQCFDYVLRAKPQQIAIADIEWDALWRYRPDLKDILVELAPAAPDPEQGSTYDDADDAISQNEDGEERTEDAENTADHFSTEHIRGFLEQTICDLTGLSDAEEADFSTGFMELGLDSFKLYQLTEEVNKALIGYGIEKFSLSVIDLFEQSSVEKLTDHLRKNFLQYAAVVAPNSQVEQSVKPTEWSRPMLDILAMSAASELAMQRNLNALETFIDDSPNVNILDVSYTLSHNLATAAERTRGALLYHGRYPVRRFVSE
ncbi:Beta-ketoacyl synthaseN-terminal domain containing protein, partial [Aphelenchoides avenae]